MKLINLLGWSSALCLSAAIAQAQETNQLEKFDKRLKEIQESFDKQQREMRESFERLLREQQGQIDALKKQLATATNAVAGAGQTNQAAGAEQLQELKQTVEQVVEAQKKIRPGEFNPAIGLVGETIFCTARKAPAKRAVIGPGVLMCSRDPSS